MNEKTRIEKIILAEGMTSGQFAQEIGVQNSTLSHILNNRNNPSLDVIKKILNRFSVINSDWLILGQGPMYRQESQSQTPSLFEFEDETDSVSNDLGENITENTHTSFLSTEKKPSKSTIQASTTQFSQINESTSSQQSLSQKSDTANRSVVNQSLDEQLTRSGNKNDNLLIEDKKATKIILYYSDNTFQEFESK